MIYDKLPVVFLSTLAAEKKDSTNSVIAEYILAHQSELADVGIKELAEKCHVGTGSISRFCKEIGLNDFAELKVLLGNTAYRFEREDISADPLVRMQAWGEHICESVKNVVTQETLAKTELLCQDLRKYEKVSAFGMLKAETAAINLQVDMMMLGKQIHTAVPYAEQMEHILNAGKDELIIIFSYTGSYFEYQSFRAKEKHLALPKIWMICGSDKKMPWFINDVIRFPSPLDQQSHPYQLLAVSGMISQQYAAKIPDR